MKHVLFAGLILLLAGCGTTATDVQEFNISTADVPAYSLGSEYRIGVEDVLAINVWRNPDLAVTVPVRPDGKISMPLIGDVQAGGLTPAQVTEDIGKRLSRYIRDPQVAVIVTQLRSHEYLSRVRVTGAVRNPVSLPFRQGMTVLDAVLAAGGVNDFAAPARTRLYRKGTDRTRVLQIDLDGILTEGALETNVVLKPGDIITVPERLF
ncbi:MAG TPA: sugar ABC transporter substrate-binding protein [Gammaproteobacteria bacterium]|nr:sugar ABC transporter substrate-binding protein [Gammaproteobacteria bacterium]